MPRPREYEERVSTTLRVTPELLSRLDAEAQRREIGRNLLTVKLIEYALPDYEAEDV